MSRRHVLSIAVGLAVLLNAGRAACQPAPPQHEYHVSWIALASPEPISARVESKSRAKLVTFRPERAFVLQVPLAESDTSKPRLEADTAMVGMKDGRGIACRLERPTHVCLVECVEDADLDGQYEAFFLLNHDNPFLFSARRQPRHQKVTPIQPVTMGEVAAEQTPTLDMVLIYSKRSAISAATGAHTFQLCIRKPGVRDIWGDKTVGRGCLPDVVVRHGEFPRQLKVYGRTLTIDAPVDGVVPVSVTAHPEDMPVSV